MKSLEKLSLEIIREFHSRANPLSKTHRTIGQRVENIIKEHDKEMIKELAPYLKHHLRCYKSHDPDSPSHICTCGLDEILDSFNMEN